MISARARLGRQARDELTGPTQRSRRVPLSLAPLVVALVALALRHDDARTVAADLRPLWPALAFLALAVPLAVLLDRVRFFDALADLAERRSAGAGVLWLLAAVTTATLNLDTTIVLLTPLFLRLARRRGDQTLALVFVPVLLANLASSVLAVSNLTTLIAAEHGGLTSLDVSAHLALPTLAACAAGWLVHRRRLPRNVAVAADDPTTKGAIPEADRRALLVGGIVVGGLLLGFVVGPLVGVPVWATVAAADVVLVVITRSVPWRAVPIDTIVLVLSLAVLAFLAFPGGMLSSLLQSPTPSSTVVATGAGIVSANVMNNLPAFLVALPGLDPASWASWGFLLGVNAGAVLLPIGSLANLLWLQILRTSDVRVSWREFARHTWPVAAAALPAATLVLVAQQLVTG